MKVILTIAGSDSSAGAGMQADIKSIGANGGFATTAVTAVTAQNTVGVQAIEFMSPKLVRAQIDSVFADLPVAAVKTGMLGTAEVVEEVARAIDDHNPEFFVLDPVICAAGGDLLMDDHGIAVLVGQLTPLATVLTPNIYEARAISGIAIESLTDVERAAKKIVEMGAKAVIVTGGALDGESATDVLVTREGAEVITGEWLKSANTNGTGCTLSAAIATWLARGQTLRDALVTAKGYTLDAIRHGPDFGAGRRATDHLFLLKD